MDAPKPRNPGEVADRNLALELVRVTEAAAIAASRWIGLGNKNDADGAAVEAMRRAFDTVGIDGTVVIGEGEMDEAPMLYIGEKVGAGGPPMDIAVDPLEGTTLTAKGGPNAHRRHRAGRARQLPARARHLHGQDRRRRRAAGRRGRPGRAGGEQPAQPGAGQEVRRFRPGRLHPRPRPPQGADRQDARGRRAHHADQRRRRGRA